MKKTFLTILLSVALFGCGVNSSSNIDFEGEDIKHVLDSRTNLCFGVVASRKSNSISTTGLGLTCVPCDSVKHLIK